MSHWEKFAEQVAIEAGVVLENVAVGALHVLRASSASLEVGAGEVSVRLASLGVYAVFDAGLDKRPKG